MLDKPSLPEEIWNVLKVPSLHEEDGIETPQELIKHLEKFQGIEKLINIREFKPGWGKVVLEFAYHWKKYQEHR